MNEHIWLRRAFGSAPFLFGMGLVVMAIEPSLLGITSGSTHALDELGVGLGINLLASVIYSLSQTNPFKMKDNFERAVVNHDVLRMAKQATSESAKYALDQFCNLYSHDSSQTSMNLNTNWPLPRFIQVLSSLRKEDFWSKDEDFDPTQISDAIIESQRSLLSVSTGLSSKEIPAHILERAEGLEKSLVKHILSIVESKIHQEVEDADASRELDPSLHLLQVYLEGKDDRAPGGFLNILSRHIAAHLKIDTYAQIAVLHSTLRDQADTTANLAARQSEIRSLCEQVLERLGRLEQYEQTVRQLVGTVEEQIRHAIESGERPPLRLPYLAGSQRPLNSLHYGARSSPLVGRESAMNALWEFIARNTKDRGLWTVISGEAGTGKSRLAAELICKLRGDSQSQDGDQVSPGIWRAGFLDGPWLSTISERWRAETDTLLVLDYNWAREEIGDLRRFLGGLVGRPNEDSLNCRVRVILIDRATPDSTQGLAKRLSEDGTNEGAQVDTIRWSAVSAFRNAELLTPSTAYPSKAIQDDPLYLRPLAGTAALEVVSSYASRPLTTSETTQLSSEFGRDPELARPLFLAVIGHALRYGDLPGGSLDPVAVAEIALQHQFARIGRKEFLEEAKDLIAVATAAQGMPVESLLNDDRVLAELTGNGRYKDADARLLMDALSRICIVDEHGQVPPLEPDFLGELFVLDRVVGGLGQRRALAKADSLMSAAWKYGTNPKEFIVRLARDFAARPDKVAEALHRHVPKPTAHEIDALLKAILFSPLTRDGLSRGGASIVPATIYCYAAARRFDLARDMLSLLQQVPFLEEAESTKAQSSGVRAEDLGWAWASFAIGGNVRGPEISLLNEALLHIDRLSEIHGNEDFRLSLSEVLLEKGRQLGELGQDEEAIEAYDEMLQLCGQSSRTEVADALWHKGMALWRLGRNREAIAAYDDLLQRFGEQYSASALRLQTATVMWHKGLILRTLGDREGQVAAYTEMLRRFEETTEPLIQMLVAQAMLYKGVTLEDLGRHEHALLQWNELILRFRHCRESDIQEQVARAMFNTGGVLLRVGRYGEALETLGVLKQRLLTATDPQSHELMAKVLHDEGTALWELGQHSAALAGWEELLVRFGQSPEPVMQELVANTIVDKCVALGKLGRLEEVLRAHDELIQRVGESPQPVLQEAVSRSRLYRGVALIQLGRHEQGFAELERLIRCVRVGTQPSHRKQLAEAIFYKAVALVECGRQEEGVAAYNELMQLDLATGLVPDELLSTGMLNRGLALAQLNRYEEAIVTYDELKVRYVEAAERDLRECVVKAIYSKGLILSQHGRNEEALVAYCELTDRYGEIAEPSISEKVATTLFNSGLVLFQLGRYEDAFAKLDELVRRFDQSEDPALREPIANALWQKGSQLEALARHREAITSYDEMLQRFGQRPFILVRKGMSLSQIGQHMEAFATYNEAVKCIDPTTESSVHAQLAAAMFNTGFALSQLGRHEEAIAVYDALVERFSHSSEPTLQEVTASAMLNRGVTVGNLGQHDKALAVWDELIQHFGQTQEPVLRKTVAIAISYKGVALWRLGRGEESLAEWNHLLRSFGDDIEMPVREIVALAMFNKGLCLSYLGSYNRALVAFVQLVERVGQGTEPAIRELVAKVLYDNRKVLSHRGRRGEMLTEWDDLVQSLGEATESALRKSAAKTLSQRLAFSVKAFWLKIIAVAKPDRDEE